jgi:fatty acid desaturase
MPFCGVTRSFSSAHRTQKLIKSGGTKVGGILWAIIVIVLVIYLFAFLLHFGGGLIHLLLIVVVILVIWNLITVRKRNP